MTTLLFVVLALLGLPLFVVLGAAALTATREAQLDPALLMVEFARLAASPNLVAIPLFVLAGATLGWVFNAMGDFRRGTVLMKRAVPQYMSEEGARLPVEVLKVAQAGRPTIE